MKRVHAYLAIAAISVTVIAAIAAFAPRIAAGGWLLAFTYVSAFPLGSLALMMIHRLTGGRWGESLDPFLRPVVQTTPLLLLLVVPALIATSVLFSWTHGSFDGVTHSVRLIYLNIPAYVIRSLVALTGWSVLAFALPSAEGNTARLMAGLGLLFHGIAITFVAQDWVLAAEPPEPCSTNTGWPVGSPTVV